MRQMTYTRELGWDEYVVHGYNDDFRYRMGETGFKPIQMELAKAKQMSKERQDEYWNYILKAAGSDLFGDPNQIDFTQSYAAIVKGERPDWRMSAFRVFVGGIELFYNNIETKEHAFLWIMGRYAATKLKFECAKNCFGFTPTYYVECYSDRSTIKEDLGYICNEVILKLKDPKKIDDNLFHDNNTVAEITEYAGI